MDNCDHAWPLNKKNLTDGGVSLNSCMPEFVGSLLVEEIQITFNR